MNKKRICISMLLAIFMILFNFVSFAKADVCSSPYYSDLYNNSGGCSALNTFDDCFECYDVCGWDSSTCVDLPESSSLAIAVPDPGLPTSFSGDIFFRIIDLVSSVAGSIAVIVILYGGFQWMTSVGEEAKVKKAKDTLKAGIIGLAIVVSAYAITRFVVGIFDPVPPAAPPAPAACGREYEPCCTTFIPCYSGGCGPSIPGECAADADYVSNCVSGICTCECP